MKRGTATSKCTMPENSYRSIGVTTGINLRWRERHTLCRRGDRPVAPPMVFKAKKEMQQEDGVIRASLPMHGRIEIRHWTKARLCSPPRTRHQPGGTVVVGSEFFGNKMCRRTRRASGNEGYHCAVRMTETVLAAGESAHPLLDIVPGRGNMPIMHLFALHRQILVLVEAVDNIHIDPSNWSLTLRIITLCLKPSTLAQRGPLSSGRSP